MPGTSSAGCEKLERKRISPLTNFTFAKTVKNDKSIKSGLGRPKHWTLALVLPLLSWRQDAYEQSWSVSSVWSGSLSLSLELM